jgi:naphthalene 1,2-dioxygenase system ferredoxin subunit
MSNDNWTDALAAADLPAGDVTAVTVAGREIALYSVGDEVFATDNLCTHGPGRLCDGFLLTGGAAQCASAGIWRRGNAGAWPV